MPKLLKIKTGVDTTTDDIVVKKAQQLATARLINGVPFDGTQDINLDPGTSENSDKVDGFHASIENTASTVVVRDTNKNINIDSAATTWIDFNTTTETLGITELAGRLYFNEEHDTLAFKSNSGNVVEIGEELYMPLAHNNSTENIPNGYLVMATGANGDKINIARAVTDGSIEAQYIIGVATVDIPIDSENGRITTQGYVKHINTNAWDVGTILYPDPNIPGWWTSAKPEAPAINTPLAIVIKKNQASGIILVRMAHFSAGSGSGGASVTIDSEAPSESNNGDLWWDNTSGNLFINYDDGDSTQWVQINQNNFPTLTVESIPELPINKIINLETSLANINNWDTAYVWGNHAVEGYFKTSSFNALDTSIIPATDDAVDLGSPTKKFRELYLSGGTLYIGSLAIKDNNGEIEFQRNNNGTMVAATIKNEIDFTTIKNKPTTLNGFGITDAVVNTRTINGFNLQSNIVLTNDSIDIVSETITSSVTLNINNKNRILKVNSSSAVTITIPSNSSVGFPINTEIAIIREGTGTITVSPGSGVTLQSTDSKRKIKGQYSSAALLKTHTDTWLLIGSIEA